MPVKEGRYNFQKRRWLARVWAGGESRTEIMGAAFAIDERHLLTCAHVVEEAGATKPGTKVYVDFPLVHGAGCWAKVLESGWSPTPGPDEPASAGDLAVLELLDPPVPIEALPLRRRESYKGLSFSSYGFPPSHPESDAAHGRLGLMVGLQWVRLEADSSAIVEPGFSGGAVWADDADGAVAMILTRKTGDGRVAYAVPIAVAADSSEIVANALKGRTDPLGWLDRVPVSFQTDLIPFTHLIEEHTIDFVGREFVFEALNTRFQDPEFRSGYVLIHGEPGIGKSAIIAQLARTHGYVHHFNVAPDNIRSPKQFLRNTCSQLIVRYELPYAEMPDNAHEDSTFLKHLLQQSVAKIRDTEARVVLLVDALDEAERTPEVNRLFLPRTLPEGAYVVATIRTKVDPELDVNQLAEGIEIREGASENEADIKDYILNFLDRNRKTMNERLEEWKAGEPSFNDSTFTNIIWQQSEGNFMYLRHVLQAILAGSINRATIGKLEKLPKGLTRYYARHWKAMEDADRERFRRLQRPVICTLAKAKEAVSAVQVAEWINLSGDFERVDVTEVEDVFDEWSEFLNEQPGDPPLFRLYHKSFLDFLESTVALKRYGESIARAMRGKVTWDAE
jgi:trypsin-like peptidase/AAA ATPase-like protein